MSKEAISLIGYGVSNKAVYEYFKQLNCPITVRTPQKTDVPVGTRNIYGESYLDTNEDMVFRSPSVLPSRIKGKGRILCESEFALSGIDCTKIGITGSDGKTTVSTLIHKILNRGRRAYLGGNIGYPLINYVGKLKKDDTLVCELSSFQLFDMKPQLDVSVITNITPNHLDIHKSYVEYISAKLNILKNAKYSVLGLDAYKIVHSVAEFEDKRLCVATLDDMSHSLNCRLDFVYPKGEHLYFNKEPIVRINDIKLRGSFNLLNVCIAIGATYNLTSADKIKDGIESFYGVDGRMEHIGSHRGVDYYDSAIDSTPSRTLATVSAFDKSRTVIILGGYDKNLSYEELGKGLTGIKHAVICGSNSEKIAYVLKNRCNFTLCDSFSESVKIASRVAKEGDNVLLSPASASYDMFENYKKKSDKFKEIVRGL